MGSVKPAQAGRTAFWSVQIVAEVVPLLASESGAYPRKGLDLLRNEKLWVLSREKDGSARRRAYTLPMQSFET